MKTISLLLSLAGLLGVTSLARSDDHPLPKSATKVPLVFQGGHDTDPRDHGRPVVLVAGAKAAPSADPAQAFTDVWADGGFQWRT